MKRIFFSFGLMLLSYTFSNGQEWAQMLSNTQEKNFKEIQTEFNKYWEGREVTKGKGYKQFKRWEWYWEDRLMPDGSFPNPNHNLNAFNRFIRLNPGNSRNSTTSWQSLGPNSSNGGYAGIGRVNSIGFHPTNTDIVFAGAAGGGLWQSNDGGLNWFTNTDNIGSLGVSGIVVDELNPNIIYIATGDGDAGDNYSVGVLKSTDGGLAFNATGLSWNTSSGIVIRRLIADPNDNNTLIAATSDGIYRTTNAGVNWTQEISGSFYDVEPKYGASSDIFYASTYNRVYKSSDNGNTWATAYTVANSNRVALATSPANTSYLYVLSSGNSSGSNGGSGFNELLRSTDSGNTFTSRSTSPNILDWSTDGSGQGGQGWYDLAFAMDPSNANTIFVGGVNTWKSTNGGSSWTLVNHWTGAGGVQAVHADKHVLEFQGSVLWEGNDGGVYKTTNGGNNWTDLANGMVISQMYRVGVSQSDDIVITGLQDNGTKWRNNVGDWEDEIGGDGMDCAIDPSNSNTMYASLYYGAIFRSTNGGTNWTNIRDNISGTPSGAWITPFVLDQIRPDTIIAGFDDVYRSFNRGTSWTKISNNLTGGSNLSYVRVSESNPDYIYAGDSNELWRTTNGGASWQTRSTPRNNTKTIIIHPNNPDSLWAVSSNYNSSGQKVYVSGNGGATWSDISGNLPNIPANTIVYLKGSNNGIYVGMDIGVYYKDDNLPNWSILNNSLPNVEITELDINYSNNSLYASTYGRGLWKADLSSCQTPLELTLDSLVVDTGYFSWIAPATTSIGYDYQLTNSIQPPPTFNSTTNLYASAGSISYGQDFYFHVRTDCGNGEKSFWEVIGPLDIPPSCGDAVFDTGGSGSNYSNEEDYSMTICPQLSGQKVEFSFNAFNVESTWDALYVYDGPDTNSPIFNSGNPPTQAGFPAGGFYGTNIPGPFTSTHSSGCLTLEFKSDEYVTRSGWDIDIGCTTPCASTVFTTEDDVYGSLRNVINCNPNGGNIVFDLGLLGDTLQLSNETLVFGANYQLQVDNGMIFINSNINGPIFNISENSSVFMKNLQLIPKPNTEALYIEGFLRPFNLIIKNQNNTITNKGTIFLSDSSNFIFEE